MRQERIEDVREEARKYFGNVSPSHDWNHVKRVYNIAEKLLETENADQETVTLAVLLHDIGRHKEDNGEIENHEKWGAEKAAEILRRKGFGVEKIEEVTHCIDAHRFSTQPEPRTLEAKIVSDADNLDALGATGIARAFCYAGESNETLVELDLPSDESESKATSFRHLERYLLKLKNRMYTDTGREIAEKRHVFVEEYKERFKQELEVHK